MLSDCVFDSYATGECVSLGPDERTLAEGVVKASISDVYKRVFFLGPYARRVSFSSQQNRALNLVWAIDRLKRIQLTDRKVAVVGGGLAGVTTCVALAELGYSPYLFESGEDVLNRQASARHRYIHPTVNRWGSEQEQAFRSHLDRLTQNLVESAMAVWRPLAERLFEQRTGEKETTRARAPVAPKLAVATDGVSVDLMGLLDAGKKRAVRNEEEDRDTLEPRNFLNSAFDIFVAAGVLALLSEQWRFADHFCLLATKSVEFFEGKAARLVSGAVTEAYYLSALSKRFRMGELNIGSSLAAYEQASYLFSAALAALQKHEKHAADEEANQARTAFRIFRSHSEQAALCLFMAEIAWTTSRLSPGTTRSKALLDEARARHADAGDHLLRCIQSQQRHYRHDLSLKSADEAHRLIKTQSLINIAAYYVLGGLMDGPTTSFGKPALEAELDRNLESLESLLGEDERLFRIELDIFRQLRGAGPVTLAELEIPSTTLAIDGRFWLAIMQKWGQA